MWVEQIKEMRNSIFQVISQCYKSEGHFTGPVLRGGVKSEHYFKVNSMKCVLSLFTMVSDVLWHVYVILNAKADECRTGRLQFSFALEPGMAKFVTLRGERSGAGREVSMGTASDSTSTTPGEQSRTGKRGQTRWQVQPLKSHPWLLVNGAGPGRGQP